MSEIMQRSDVEQFLIRFHAKHPGCTSKVMAQALNAKGESSYELIAKVVPRGHSNVRILDLACGDGYLLELLLERTHSMGLFGIDMSEAELSAAQERLPLNVDLRIGKSQALPFAPESFDFVTCHMAFMLMNSLDQVVQEIHRVLKPGGKFLAVISGGRSANPVDEACLKLLRESAGEKYRTFASKFSDARLASTEGIRSIFNEGFEPNVPVENHLMGRRLDVNQAAYNYMTYYGSGFMTDHEFAATEKKMSELVRSMVDPDGLVLSVFSAMTITAQKTLPVY